MRVLVYEHLTATGDGRDPASPQHAMDREGRAMRDALATDLRAVPGLTVANDALDLAVVIAPETDGILEDVIERFRRTVPVVASSPAALALTRDKLALAKHWAAHGVPTPRTTPAAEWPSHRRPAVFKPRDGAGSCATRFVAYEAGDLGPGEFIAQDFVPGQAASVAFLIGPHQTVPLLPTFQHLSDDGEFHYLGGELPIPPALAARATDLAWRAVACVPGLAGYVGVDLVLGTDGGPDYALEINPRLTTSYVGLRALAASNLAAAMLDVFHGKTVDPPRWKAGRVLFRPDGSVVVTSG